MTDKHQIPPIKIESDDSRINDTNTNGTSTPNNTILLPKNTRLQIFKSEAEARTLVA